MGQELVIRESERGDDLHRGDRFLVWPEETSNGHFDVQYLR
ncbi:hypothetical protein Bdt_1388 [Bdellovibrio bacteriovorus str. Tiberius]|uniref:Uncharacterized protein n=1 Tax=Bdellovibrio bacteriovorus str. Tiberius TaxID=1069642 RepID=K7YMQ3_BDEBC|nr:hypothetical protein Bdt_1388 [Bdellovibrio bacteriovorus str. Tiberius]